MSEKKSDIPSEFFAEMEGDYAPFAAAPRHFERKTKKAAGYQELAIERVRETVLKALLETGYDRALAEQMADEMANTLPSIQEHAESQAA